MKRIEPSMISIVLSVVILFGILLCIPVNFNNPNNKNSEKMTSILRNPHSSDPTFTNVSNNFADYYGYTNQTINWTATGGLDMNYTVHQNGMLIRSGLYTNNTLFQHTIVDGLSPGDYYFTFELSYINNSNQSIVLFSVLDEIHPIFVSIPSQGDMFYNNTYPSIQLNWSAQDDYEGTYSIEINSNKVVSNENWVSSINITFDLPNDLSPGVYNISLQIQDTSGNINISSVFFTLNDTIDPEFTQIPYDLAVYENYSNFSFIWTINDVSSGTFTIWENGSKIVNSTSWNSNTPIKFNILNGKPIGSYNYTIVVVDLYGNSANDTVVFEVRSSDHFNQDANNEDTANNTNKNIPAYPLKIMIFIFGVSTMLLIIFKRRNLK